MLVMLKSRFKKVIWTFDKMKTMNMTSHIFYFLNEPKR